MSYLVTRIFVFLKIFICLVTKYTNDPHIPIAKLLVVDGAPSNPGYWVSHTQLCQRNLRKV